MHKNDCTIQAVLSKEELVQGCLASLESGRAYALANSSRTGVGADEVNRSYNEQKSALQDKLESVNSIN